MMNRFKELCRALCTAAGQPIPDLEPDAAGHIAIGITIDVIECVLEHRSCSPDLAHLDVVFGKLPAEGCLAACRSLMDVNSALVWNGNRAFSRDPSTGEVVLRLTYRLGNETGAEVYSQVRELADIAGAWRLMPFAPFSSAGEVKSPALR